MCEVDKRWKERGTVMVKVTLGCGEEKGTELYINPLKIKAVSDFHSPDPYYEEVNACIEFDTDDDVEYVKETAKELVERISIDRALDFERFSKAMYEEFRWLR